ncbi:MAG: chromosomal replication initiator DnaA [Xanthobacteraceae bacterium]|nr:chromosomal replication initiator DnaA [Xanthobacteraceae bacterium]
MVDRGVRPRQLAFALPHAESLTRDNFLEGPSNCAALALIDRWPDWPGRSILLAGPEGCGKSHLASIWAEHAGARVISARALNDAEVPEALATGALVVEDLVSGGFDERSLFHLMNLAREHEAFVLFTARAAPAGFDVALPDLRSRLRALPVVQIGSPDDALFRALIVKFAADRQIALDESVVAYLERRIERSVAAAREVVAHLDLESLRLGRPVTRALAAEVLREDG